MTFLDDEQFFSEIESETELYQKNKTEDVIGCYDFEEEKREMLEQLGVVANG